MEQTSVQKLARVLRVLVIITFVCNLIALTLVPLMVIWDSFALNGIEFVRGLWRGSASNGGIPHFFAVFLSLWAGSFWEIFLGQYTAMLAMFLWVCGVCTAVILWQGKRVIDTILKGEPFTFGNACNLRRAAVCCFVISGAALVRLIWGFAYYQSIAPLLTYNALFVPIFFMAGLVCMVMSALFRQAAELKAENDLTI